ncbi:MFS transporter [Pigmentiphaga sp. D-2]|uniref:MFS transporter n=1 Tax=Pigmentiphaga sp. D-2 TaxID=1002116 RepID=UPI00104BF04F|nr:MFS transporter [Pigmentiphaga sp. D-2]
MDANMKAAHTSKTIVLAAVCLAGLMMPLSFTGPAVATPAIARDLGGSPVALAWVVNAFVLAFGSFVLAAGTLAQEFEGPARTRAFSLLGTTFGVGLAFGPIWSGLLIEHFGWRSIFLTGAVIGALVLLFGVPRMRETRDPDARGMDGWGTLTFTVALSLLIFGIVTGPQYGWTGTATLALLGAALAMLAAFVAIELKRARPMLDLSLLRYPRFVGVQLLPLATAVCYVVLLILLPIGFIGVEGYSELKAGIMMIPLSLPMAIVPFLAGLLARRYPAGALSAGGLVIAAAGLAWLATMPVGQQSMAIIWPMLLIGIGTGLPWGLMDDLSVSVVPKERAGMATGIFSTMRLAGEAVALAAAAALLLALMQSGLAQALPDARAMADISAIANDMAAGALGQAATHLGDGGKAMLVAVYADAFRALLLALAALTVAAALAAWLLLRPATSGKGVRADACTTHGA